MGKLSVDDLGCLTVWTNRPGTSGSIPLPDISLSRWEPISGTRVLSLHYKRHQAHLIHRWWRVNCYLYLAIGNQGGGAQRRQATEALDQPTSSRVGYGETWPSVQRPPAASLSMMTIVSLRLSPSIPRLHFLSWYRPFYRRTTRGTRLLSLDR